MQNHSEALDMHLGIAILRVSGGLDYSKMIEDDDLPVIVDEKLAGSNDDAEKADGNQG